MRKKLVFGIILVLTLLLLMPSISAIQTNVVKDEILIKIHKDLDFKEMNDLGDVEKFPNLYEFLARWLGLRFGHGLMLCWLGIPFYYNSPFGIITKRGIWLCMSSFYIADILDFIVEKLGWNWESLSDYIG